VTDTADTRAELRQILELSASLRAAEARAEAAEAQLSRLMALPDNLPRGISGRLTPTQRRILGAICKSEYGPRSKRAVADAIGITPDTLDTHICYMRHRLKGTSVSIETHWGFGYSATWKEAAE
jgi:DNA-binding response OmpR family regulator